MALTKVQILSMVLGCLGHKAIQTLGGSDSDELTVQAEAAFDLLLPYNITKNSWRFAANIVQLANLNISPPVPTYWKSVYQLPSGWLKTIRLYPHNYQWEIYNNNQIFSLWTGDMYMEYLFQPDISQLPPWFTIQFVYEVAAYLCLSNAQKIDYYAAIEKKRKEELSIAMAIDAQNRPSKSLASFPVLNASLKTPGGLIIG